MSLKVQKKKNNLKVLDFDNDFSQKKEKLYFVNNILFFFCVMCYLHVNNALPFLNRLEKAPANNNILTIFIAFSHLIKKNK